MRTTNYKLDLRKRLIEMLLERWVSTEEIKRLYNVSNERVYRIIDGITTYPVAEEKRKNIVYFKIMTKKDYEQ